MSVMACGGFLYYRANTTPAKSQEWEEVTNFSDSVVSPALSPDGRMLTFVRSGSTFAGNGELYVKMLPRGEPVELTHDRTMKTDPVFTPDGSRITYTVANGWDTWVVPVLGGNPQVMLPNASGLTWTDDQHILFSEIKNGVHMAVVTATQSRTAERDVYVPSTREGMAHRSYLSPDHKWALVASEMDVVGNKPCRLVPFDGSSAGRIVGPKDNECSSAAWSMDGKWMFFSAATNHGFHLWRQKFPDGEPEQITFGPTEEEGIALAPDGRSLLTSVGLAGGSVWIRDATGERQVLFEGQARLMVPQFSSRSAFSPEGSKIFFLGRRNPNEPEELWGEDLHSGATERPVPGMTITHSYDVSPDGKLITFDSDDAQGNSHVWIASLDRRQPPRQVGSGFPEGYPVFGPKGGLYFQRQEGEASYLYRRDLDTGDTVRVMPTPIVRLHTVSPDGKWIVLEMPVTGDNATRGIVAYRTDTGATQRICHNLCIVRWTQNGKHVFIALLGSGESYSEFKTFIVPLRQGEAFPDLPTGGVQVESDLAHLRGVAVLQEFVLPGPDASRYAVSRWTVQRNIYRIPIP